MTAVRTLVVHTGGIGDFLLTCPALERLASEGPVELLGRPGRLTLAVAAGIAHAAHDIDAAEFHSVFTTPSERLRALVQRFDRCVVWMRDDGTIDRALRRCGLRDLRLFPGLPPPDWPAHASAYYLERLGYTLGAPLRLAIDPAPEPRDVVIHPGSGSASKNWPACRFEALARELTRHNRHVTWCTGPAEETWPPPHPEALLQTKSLVDLARQLAATRLYIGNDSGITHLAAAVGCRTVAIFGPTSPHVWAPRGDHVAVINGDPWPDTAAVLARIET